MRAVVVGSYGGAEGVHLRDVPVPVVGASDVLVEVHAAGVNPLDNKVRAGGFTAFLPYEPPFADGASAAERAADPDQVLSDRYRRLPPAVSISTTVAIVGAVPTVPLGPEGAAEGGDGD